MMHWISGISSVVRYEGGSALRGVLLCASVGMLSAGLTAWKNSSRHVTRAVQMGALVGVVTWACSRLARDSSLFQRRAITYLSEKSSFDSWKISMTALKFLGWSPRMLCCSDPKIEDVHLKALLEVWPSVEVIDITNASVTLDIDEIAHMAPRLVKLHMSLLRIQELVALKIVNSRDFREFTGYCQIVRKLTGLSFDEQAIWARGRNWQRLFYASDVPPVA